MKEVPLNLNDHKLSFVTTRKGFDKEQSHLHFVAFTSAADYVRGVQLLKFRRPHQ